MNTPEIPTEWEALNNLDQGIYKLQNALHLMTVLSSATDELISYRTDISTGAMYALLAHLEDCARELGEANKAIWKIYREKNNLPEPSSMWANLEKAQAVYETLSGSKSKPKPKRKKSNVKK
jgi:hypothetical protein